jgi:hypothetical protein
MIFSLLDFDHFGIFGSDLSDLQSGVAMKIESKKSKVCMQTN